jgi:hypothetical protein
MRVPLGSAVMAIALLAGVMQAVAQPARGPGTPDTTRGPPEMMRSPPEIMRGGRMMADGFRHIEGRLAFLRAELNITDAQAPQWNAFADAVRAQTEHMRQAIANSGPVKGDESAPDLLERRLRLLTARTEALRTVLASVEPLYAVLTDQQKQAADALIRERFMAGRMR